VIKKITHILAIVAFVLLITTYALCAIIGSSNTLSSNLEDLINKELIQVDPQPPSNMVDAIYVLGGTQSSLEFKFNTAAILYSDGICKKILILSRPGKTGYSSLLKRNLTNDEWAILKLQQLKIPKKDVELIYLGKGAFGTLAEAKAVSTIVKEKGYKGVILICSPYHSHRVRISFKKFLNSDNASLNIQGSGESVSLRELLIEFMKLKIYQHVLLFLR
jgi:uncharacterized SAM-binding protein YcdF (DUF218 family)